MRGFPPTYLNANPNPHMAATYMANLNKAAAYAAAVSANRHHSLMTPVYHQNQAMATSHEDLTAEGRMRVQQQQTKASAVDPYNQNIYAVSENFKSFPFLPSFLSFYFSPLYLLFSNLCLWEMVRNFKPKNSFKFRLHPIILRRPFRPLMSLYTPTQAVFMERYREVLQGRCKGHLCLFQKSRILMRF